MTNSPSGRRDTGTMSAAKLIAICVAVVVVIIGVPLAIWSFRVATSDIKGQGDSTIQVNDANNRLAQERVFNELYTGIQAKDANIQGLADRAAKDPTSDKAQEDFAGTQMICRSDVAKYNSMVSAPQSAKWLPAGLPSVLGQDPATDCEPNVKPSAVPVPGSSSN